MHQTQFDDLALKISKTLGLLNNINRAKIVLLCSQKPHTVTEIAKKINLSIGRVSHNLTILDNAKLVSREKNKDNTVTVRSLIKITKNLEVVRI